MSFLVIVQVPYEPIPEKVPEEPKKDETILESKLETGENTDNEKSYAETDDEASSSGEVTTSDTSERTEFEAWDLSDTEDYKSAPSTEDVKPAQSTDDTKPSQSLVNGGPEVRESSTDPSQPALPAASSSTQAAAKKKKTFGVTRVPSQEQHDKAVDEERKKRKKKKKQKRQEKITEEKRPSQGSVDAKSLKSETGSAKSGVKTDESKVMKVSSEDSVKTTNSKRPSEGSLKVENNKQPMKGSLEHLFSKPSTEDKVLLNEKPRSSSCEREPPAADFSKQTTSDKAKDKQPAKGSLDHLFSQPPQPAAEEEELLGSKSRSTSCDSEPEGIKQTTSDKKCSEKSLTDINDNSKTEVVKDKNSDNEEEKEKNIAKDAEDYTLEQEDEEEHELKATDDTPLTPLFEKIPIHKRVEIELDKMGVEAVEIELVGHGEFSKISFIQDDSHKCEKILNRLRGIGVGITAGSSISVFPASLHERGAVESERRAPSADDDTPVRKKSEALAEKKSEFKKSVKSRLLVAQVVKSVRANAEFTFDYLLLLILAGLIACLGLVENSSVVLVASMLISPLMGPILAATFGQVIRKKDLRDLGLKSEIKGLVLCLIVGFTFGLIAGGVGLHGAIWGSTDTWPTSEMKSRGMLRSLWVGVLIALPSGAGVAISVLGGNSGSLVGVAISASLLPPACNAGMLWAYALLAAIRVPPVESMSSAASSLSSNITNTTTTTMSPTTVLPPQMGDLGCPPLVNNKYEPEYFCNISHDAALLGLVSLFLTIVNICCIIIMGVLVLKIKEVAPKTAGVDTFWREDVQVARGYYSTAKGATSKNLGKTFLEEYKKIQEQAREMHPKKKKDRDEEAQLETDTSDSEEFDDEMAAIEMNEYLKDLQQSSSFQDVYAMMPIQVKENVADDIQDDYDDAQNLIAAKLARKPEVYLAEPTFKDKNFKDKQLERAYMTIHSGSHSAMRSPLKKRMSEAFDAMNLDMYNNVNEKSPTTPKTHFSPGSNMYRRRKEPKVKFQVTKIDDVVTEIP